MSDFGEIDFIELGLDSERHSEALGAFERMHLNPFSVKATLLAREHVFVRVPSGTFRISIRMQPAETSDRAECVVIHEAADREEAVTVRAEVERYFLRHFPGRTLVDVTPTGNVLVGEASTYIIYVGYEESSVG